MVKRPQRNILSDSELLQQIESLTEHLPPEEKILEQRRLININHKIGYIDPEDQRKRKLRDKEATLFDREKNPENAITSKQFYDNFKEKYAHYSVAYRAANEYLKNLQNLYAVLVVNMSNGEYTIFKGNDQLQLFKLTFENRLRTKMHVLDKSSEFLFFYCNNDIELMAAERILPTIGNREVNPIEQDQDKLIMATVNSGKVSILAEGKSSGPIQPIRHGDQPIRQGDQPIRQGDDDDSESSDDGQEQPHQEQPWQRRRNIEYQRIGNLHDEIVRRERAEQGDEDTEDDDDGVPPEIRRMVNQHYTQQLLERDLGAQDRIDPYNVTRDLLEGRNETYLTEENAPLEQEQQQFAGEEEIDLGDEGDEGGQEPRPEQRAQLQQRRRRRGN